MQGMANNVINRRLRKYDDSARTIAELFGCTENYVRMIISEKSRHRYTGEKPNKIRQAYLKYKHSKQRLIDQLQKQVA